MSDLGNKEIFSQNLNYYMDLNGVDRKRVCEDLGFAYTTFTDWCKGKIYPRIDKIELLAKYFGIMKSDLIERKSKNLKAQSIKIPILSKIIAGVSIEAVEEILDYEEIPQAMAASGEYFAWQVKGDSMEPKISEGDLVIIRRQEAVDSGDIAIVLVNEEEAIIRKIKKFDGGINLVPSNPEYDVTTYTNKDIENLPVQIIGKVVELRARFS